MLPIRKLIPGDVIAMKIGTSTKLAIGILGILIAGFIGFQVVTRQPDFIELKTESPIAEKTEQDNVSSAKDARKNLTSDTSSYPGNDRDGVDKYEAWDGVMEMLEEMEKSSDKETEIQLDQEEQKTQTSKPSGRDPMDELMAKEAEAFRQRMQESIGLGNRLLPVLAEYKAKIIKAKAEIVPAGSADPVRLLLQEVRPLISQLMEVKTFLDDYETPKVAKLLLGGFPKEAEELQQRINEFYEDYPF
jgi:hypothetical protein